MRLPVCLLAGTVASSLRGGKFIYQETYEDPGEVEDAPFPRDPAFDAEVFMEVD